MIKLYFAGTPPFAAQALEALLKQDEVEVLGVFTQPDRPAGRGQKIQYSAVKRLALAHDLPIFQPEKLNDEALLQELAPADMVIVAAYGLLLPEWFLHYPRYGCLNIHASLLPRWRGAAPIQRAIEAGDSETGVGIMQMERGLDTGAVWLEKRLSIGEHDAQSLHDALAMLGAEALLEALPLVISGTHQPRPQTGEALYATKLTKDEALLDWQKSALSLQRQVRALVGFPVAQTLWQGKSVRIWAAEALPETHQQSAGTVIAHNKQGLKVACGEGVLNITRLQLPGKSIMAAADWRNSIDLTGSRLC